MDALSKRTIQTPRGFTYTYYFSAPKDSKPTLLLQHGWPDTATLWSSLITSHLLPHGYGVIAPDLLGYRGTSKPTDPQLYRLRSMSDDLISILDDAGIDRVITVGHDWGSGLAQRVYLWHPTRVSGMILFNVAYIPAIREPFDLVKLRTMLESMIGYFTYHYWDVFSSEDGPELLNKNVNSVFDAMHGKDEGSMKKIFCSEGGMRDWLSQGKRQETQDYATEEMRAEFVERYTRDGFEGPQCWYKAQVKNFNHEDEKGVGEGKDRVDVPLLFVGGKFDSVCLTAAIYGPMQAGLLPDCEVKEVEAGHWCMLAKPKDVGEIVVKWLGEKY